MILFVDTKGMADFFYRLIEEGVKHDMKIQKEIDAENRKKEIEKQKKKIEQLKIEDAEREEWHRQYWEDPTSVMICPFGWSPFGIYL